MRITAAAAAVLLLVLLLTWFLLRGLNLDSHLSDRALEAFNSFSMLEAALQRDVLSARAGMLHNYDPLVQKTKQLNEALGRLNELAAAYTHDTISTNDLADSVARQEELIEQFKTDNALLQNSLAYFGFLSTRLCASHQADPLAPAISSLAASILHLTLDMSPATGHEVDERIKKIAAQAPQSDAASVQALLAHARKLLELLPATDGVLKSLLSLPIGSQQAAIRTMIVEHHDAARLTARRFRILLYATAVVLLGLLAHLALMLRDRARALRRRAAFEHVIARISMRFINAPSSEADAQIDWALVQMAECVGADRAYYLTFGSSSRVYTWSRRGTSFPTGWPDHVLTLAAKFGTGEEGLVHLSDVKRLPAGSDREACVAMGLRGWACASRVAGNGVTHLLGFDAVHHPCHITQAGELGLLRMALDTMIHAIERESLTRERGRLEAQLQQARRMETVGALTSGIAHNFNNIVGAILGYTEIAETQHAAHGALDRTLGEIRQAGERARDLVEHILAFGRRSKARHVSVSASHLIAEAASLLSVSLPPGIDLVIGGVPGEAIVSGEPEQLQQVIINCCKNAADAMDNVGQVGIDVDVFDLAGRRSLTHGELTKGRYVRIAVTDRGRGMDEATMARLFEPFFTTRRSGNGLGLATVREIVREHGGAIDVWSMPNAGSRFEIWLPCIDATAAVAPDATPVLMFGHGETLMVVDHDRERLLGDEEMLAALGYEPVGFTRGDDALASCWAAPERYDGIVISSVFPTKVALDLAAALHEAMPNLPVLLTTTSADEIDANALMAAGISQVISRPLIASEIAAVLARCLSTAPGDDAHGRITAAELGDRDLAL